MRLRPAVAIVEAKKREIARRYRRRRKHATKPQFAAIRITELNRLFTARYGEILPDNELGRDALFIVAHHLIHLAGIPHKRIGDWAQQYCPWLTMREFQTLLGDVAQRPIVWKADSLAWRLRLNYADRQTLKITTIGAIDCNANQRAAKRRLKQRQRMKRLRKAKRLNACAP